MGVFGSIDVSRVFGDSTLHLTFVSCVPVSQTAKWNRIASAGMQGCNGAYNSQCCCCSYLIAVGIFEFSCQHMLLCFQHTAMLELNLPQSSDNLQRQLTVGEILECG